MLDLPSSSIASPILLASDDFRNIGPVMLLQWLLNPFQFNSSISYLSIAVIMFLQLHLMRDNGNAGVAAPIFVALAI